MHKRLISLAVLALMPFAAQAQEEDGSGLTWSAAATSEYLFRGISQTDDHPALQGSIGYSFSNGLYVGAWASNVDFGAADTETDAEIDTYIGWNGDLSDSANLDVQLVRYNYVGEPDGVDYAYNELITKVTFVETYSVTLGYTNDYLNTSTDSFYAGVGGAWDVGGGYNLTAGLGYTTIQGPTDGYLDYSVGVNKDFGPVNIAVGYVGTDSEAEALFGRDNTEDRAVVTFTFGG